MSNPWDELSFTYDTTKDESEIPSRVADQILIAWPVILDFIKQYRQDDKNVRLLEYGCGVGSFAYKLSKMNYQVTGVDSSVEMIKIAKGAYGKEVDFLTGNSSALSQLTPFSIITSVMTFQFIEDIEKTFDDIVNILQPNGIFIFVVHNPALIKQYIHEKILFENFDSNENPKKGTLNLKGNKIPIFIRSADEYNKMLRRKGLKNLLEEYPPFTKEFLNKYPTSDPTDVSEFLILGYKKVVQFIRKRRKKFQRCQGLSADQFSLNLIPLYTS